MLKFSLRQLMVYIGYMLVATILVVSSSTLITYKTNQQNAQMNAAGVFRALENIFVHKPENQWTETLKKLKNQYTRPLNLIHFNELPLDIQKQKKALYAGQMIADYNNQDYIGNVDMFKPSMIYQRVLGSDLFFALEKRPPEIMEYQKNNAWIRQLAYDRFSNTPEDQWHQAAQYIENKYQVDVFIKNLSTYSKDQQQKLEKWGYLPTEPFHGVQGYIQFLAPKPSKVIIIGPYSDNWVKLHPHLYAVLIDVILLIFITLILSYPLYRDLSKLKFLAQSYGENKFNTDIKLTSKSILWSVYDTFKKMGNNIQSLIKHQTIFANMIAHEIKTPLAQINFTLHLLENSLTKEDHIEHIRSIQTDIEQIDHLINQQLDYAKYNHIKMAFKYRKVSITSITQNIFDSFKNTYDTKNWQLALPKENINVTGDELALQKLLSNLLINAYKYGGNTINVSIEKINQNAILKITDNGKGLPSTFQELLGTPFAFEAKQGGLGLAIAWSIINEHQGDITLHNTPGQVTFVIRLILY